MKNITYKQRKRLLEAMKHVTHAENRNRINGLCSEISNAMYTLGGWEGMKYDTYTSEMRWLFRKWPEFSGSEMFPVPGKWQNHDDKYVGAYGAARLRLLDFLIAETEKELAKQTRWWHKLKFWG